MSRSKARLAADWFAKLRVNATTQAVEHEDVVTVEAEVTAVSDSVSTTVNSQLTSVSSDVAAVSADVVAVASDVTSLSNDVALKLDASSYTAADVLAKIKTVDGSGSGLDADTLDGNDSSAFATAAQGTLASTAVQPNTSPIFSTINATTVDLGNWTVTESAGVLYFATSGTNKMKLDASGNLTVTGNVTGYGTV